jgi:hypothetical protein
MSIPTIFPAPIAITEIDDQIIAQLKDSKDLVVLSQVNLAARDKLSNSFFLEERYKIQYPMLQNQPYKMLTICFPNSCWKMICCALQKGTDLSSLDTIFLEKINPELIKELSSHKEICEKRISEINGPEYQHPASLAHQAWLAYKEMNNAFNSFLTTRNQLAESLGLSTKDLPHPEGIQVVLSDGNILKKDKITYTIPGTNFEVNISKKSIPDFLKLIEAEIHTDEFCNKSFDAYYNYENLCKERSQCKKEVESYNKLLVCLNSSNSCDRKSIHQSLIRTFGKELSSAQKNHEQPLLTACRELILKCCLENRKPTKKEESLIRNAINSCSLTTLAFIWGKLYQDCANEVQEDYWAEFHFSDHLSELYNIIGSSLSKDYLYLTSSS